MTYGGDARTRLEPPGQLPREHRFRLTLWIAAAEGLLVSSDVLALVARARGDRASPSGGSPAATTARPRRQVELDLRRLAGARRARPDRALRSSKCVRDRRRSSSLAVARSDLPVHRASRSSATPAAPILAVAVGRSQAVRQRVLVPRSQVRILAPQPSNPLRRDRHADRSRRHGRRARHPHALRGAEALPPAPRPAHGRLGDPRRAEAGADAARRRRLAGRPGTSSPRASRSPCRSRRSAPATRCARRAQALAGYAGDVLVLTGDMPLLTAELLLDAASRPTAPRARRRPCSPSSPPTPQLRPHRARRDGSLARIVEAGDATPEELALSEVNSLDLRLPGRRALARARPARAAERAGRALPDRHARPPRRRRRRGRGARRGRSVRGRGDQHPRRARDGGRGAARPDQRAAHARRRDDRRSRIDLDRADGRDRARRRRSIPSSSFAARRASRPAPRSSRNTVAIDAEVGAGATVGPFCYLRPGTVLEAGSKAGTFVEIKNSRIGPAHQGAAPVVHRRRRHRRGHEHRRRRDHRELPAPARAAEGPHDDRQERQDRHPQWLRRTCRGRRRSMDRSRIGDHARTSPPTRSAIARPARRTRRAMQPGSGTTELVLPGLEAAGPVTQPQPGHWIERGPQKRLMVFSGRSHPELAERIAEQLGVELGEIELTRSRTARRTAATTSRSAAPTSSSCRPAATRSTRT